MKKILLPLSIVLACVSSVCAQNTVMFDNQSGEPALVKLVGPTSNEITVANGTKQGVQASAGRYFIKVRYGAAGKYHYAKGEEFEVEETATTRSEITITLHKVVAGNYESQPISEKEFGQTQAPSTPSSPTKATVFESLRPDVQLERRVYSLLITDEHVPATIPQSTEYFIITVAVQTPTTAEDLKTKFGEPNLIESGVKYDAPRKGNIAPEFHEGDLWFYGRLGVLIDKGKAVAIVRRARLTGSGTESLKQSMAEAMSIGLPPKE